MGLKTYSLKDVIISFKGAVISGFGKDDVISVEIPDIWLEQYQGADGEVVRTFNMDKSGKATITLSELSLSNKILQGHADLAGIIGLDNAGPLVIDDLRNVRLFHSADAYISKKPGWEVKKSAGENQWGFMFASHILKH